MPAIRIAVQSRQMRNHSCPERVQMDIPNQFLKIGLFLAYNGFIPIKIILPVAIIPKDLSAFNTPDDNVMKNSWSIQAS